MKRVISLVMTAIVISSFVACGADKSTKVETITSQAVVNEKNEILVNDSLVKITLKSTSIDSSTNTFKGKKVIFEVQNKSNDEITFQTDNISVNGHMEFTFNNSNIKSGESKEIEMAFNNKNINALENIEGNFIISNKASNDSVEVIKNYSFEALEKDKYFTNRKSLEKVLVSNNSIKISLVQKMDKPKGESASSESPSIRIKIENKTKKDIVVNPTAITVDGEAVSEPYKYIVVGASQTISDNIVFNRGTVSNLKNVKGTFNTYYKTDLVKIGDYLFTIE